jgi:hypothetical protein
MKLKQKKFINILSVADVLKEQSDSIYLITHISDLNTIQNNLLKIYCDKNNIISIQPKLNLLRKITKNELFLNLYTGPTKIFFFKDPTIFLTFLKNSPIQKKIIPLTVYYNSEFYSYPKFFEILQKSNSLDKDSLQLTLISNLNNTSKIFLKNLKIVNYNFINFLSHLKINTKI